ncbi:MAG: hypothetical protein MH252_00320 [Thermosynechococcaceae cyanobacterium MS004]|nr:hypothetical protein [Thermosynechococcaceae cyanobacterium MS004]
MNIQAKLFTSAIALAMSASAVLSTTNASAYPRNNDQYRQNSSRTQQDRGRGINNNWNQNNWNQNNWNQNNRRQSDNYRTHGYPNRIQGNLPSDFRKVVYGNRTYYTRDNRYYVYDNNSRSFISVLLNNLLRR